MQINGKNIVVTGAASGIGRALLDQLAQFPAQIMAVDLDEQRLRDAVAAQANKPAKIYSIAANLMNQAGVDSVFDAATQQMGGIDIFIANAGFAYYEQLDQPDWRHIESIFQLNTFSPIYTALRLNKLNPSRPYHMVMVASAMAELNLPGYALYGATKAAIDRFAEGYRFEKPENSHLTLVYPIATRTQFFNAANTNTPTPWPSQTPETVAKAVIRGIERNQNSVYPSTFYRLGSLIARVFPWTMRLYQQMQNRAFPNWLKTRKQNP